MATTKPKIRFTYFNGRGLGEFPRLILVEAGVDFEDVRKEDIKQLKADGVLPFGQVPFFEEDGFAISQSHAIARYIAAEHNLRGKNNKAAAVADMVIEGIRDVLMKYNGYRAEKEKKEQEEFKVKFGKENLPEWLGHFEKILTKHGDFYAGDFTYADIYAYYVFNNLREEFAAAFEKTNLINAHIKRIAERPKIAKWVAARPKTAF